MQHQRSTRRRVHSAIRVYIAAPYAHKGEALVVADVLRSRGIVVVSSWHDLPIRSCAEEELPEWDLATIGATCLDEIEASGVVLHLAYPNGRGALVEVGAALGLNRGLVTIVFDGGTSSPVFRSLGTVLRNPSTDDLIKALRSSVNA